jgi:hypothetical protein
MKHTLLFNLLFFSVAGCTAMESNINSNNDTTVGGEIILRDDISIEKNFGDLMKKLDLSKDIPDVYIANKSGSEYLRLGFYPGDAKNIFSFFEISKASIVGKNQQISQSSFTSFITESGIGLNMSQKELVRKKGKRYKETKLPNGIKLRYEVSEKTDRSFLGRYKMPLYFAEYSFENDKLVKFIFGFEYP